MPSCFHAPGRRRGVALLVVLSITSVSLAILYAVLRSQTVMLQVQQNAGTRVSARHAAMAGMSIALRKMHQNDWTGVGTTLTGSLGPDAGYTVTFTTGDPQLQDPMNSGSPDPTHPDFTDWPFRMTVESVGQVSISGDGAAPAEHRLRVVMRLVPRALSTEPAPWDEINQYTVYQYDEVSSAINAPARIAGPMRLRGSFDICPAISWPDATREQYMGDLVTMHNAGGTDYRFLTGKIEMPRSDFSSSDLLLIEDFMGIETLNASPTALTGWNYPGPISTYRLYPGGKIYNVGSCPSSLSGQNLDPDPGTNPAGLFYAGGNIDIDSDVSVYGTIVTSSRLRMRGANIQARPVDLPPLHGTTEVVQLPLFVTANDFEVDQGCVASAQGMIAAWDKFDIRRAYDTDAFYLTGRAVCRELRIERPDSWGLSGGDWETLHTDFEAQLAAGEPGTVMYFPAYLSLQGYSPVPRIRIEAPNSDNPVRYHWFTDGSSIYVPAAGDAGLMWDLLNWEDGV